MNDLREAVALFVETWDKRGSYYQEKSAVHDAIDALRAAMDKPDPRDAVVEAAVAWAEMRRDCCRVSQGGIEGKLCAAVRAYEGSGTRGER